MTPPSRAEVIKGWLDDSADFVGTLAPDSVGKVTPVLTELTEMVLDADSARKQLAQVDFEPVEQGVKAFGDLGLSPAQRRERIETATGPALTEATVAVVRAVAPVAPNRAFTLAGEQAQEAFAPNGKLRPELQGEWWSNFLPKDFTAAGRAMDGFIATVQSEELPPRIDKALDVLRVIVRLEGHNLEKIAVHVPESKRPEVARALSDCIHKIGQLGIGELSRIEQHTLEKLNAEGGAEGPAARLETKSESLAHEALTQTIAALLANQVEGKEGAAAASALAEQLVKLPNTIDSARTLGNRVFQAGLSLATEPEANLSDDVREGVQAALTELRDTIAQVAEIPPEGREAIRELSKDVGTSFMVLLQFTRMAGAMFNPKMSDDERFAAIKGSAEKMGPILIKLLQTAANQEDMLDALVLSRIDGDSSVVELALEALHDAITPMPYKQVLQQISAQYDGKTPDEIFVPGSFKEKPLAAASMGQLHEAKLEVEEKGRFGRTKKRQVDVGVKVQRLGLDKEFEGTVRVTRLALAIGREAIPLFETVPEERKNEMFELVDWLESTLDSFIESFFDELNFLLEGESGQELAEDLSGQTRSTVPQVFMEQSRERVLIQELMRGEKITKVIERLDYALEARKETAPKGNLPANPSHAREEARQRCKLFARQNFGLEPTRTEVSRVGDVFDVTVHFKSVAQPYAKFEVRPDGKVRPRVNVPDLSAKSLKRLREELTGGVVAQHAIHGLAHGDPHKGNFFVMRDLKTLSYLDLGNMVRLSKGDLKSVVELLWGYKQRDAQKMAEGLYGISKKDDRQKAGIALAKEALEECMARTPEPTLKDLQSWLGEASLKSNLAVDARFLQAIKSGVSTSGNIAAINEALEGDDKKVVLRKLIAVVAQNAAGSVSPHGSLLRRAKDRRIQRLNRAP